MSEKWPLDPVAELRLHLEVVEQAVGPFNIDRLTHAENVVEESQRAARRGLVLLESLASLGAVERAVRAELEELRQLVLAGGGALDIGPDAITEAILARLQATGGGGR